MTPYRCKIAECLLSQHDMLFQNCPNKNCDLSLACLGLAYHDKGVVSPVVIIFFPFYSTNAPCAYMQFRVQEDTLLVKKLNSLVPVGQVKLFFKHVTCIWCCVDNNHLLCILCSFLHQKFPLFTSQHCHALTDAASAWFYCCLSTFFSSTIPQMIKPLIHVMTFNITMLRYNEALTIHRYIKEQLSCDDV